NFIAMEYLRHLIEPHLSKIGHLQILEYYEKHPEEFQVEDSVQWQDLFVATARHPHHEAARKVAEVLAERVRRGESFVALAKEFDNGDSSLRANAEGVGRKPGEIRPVEAEKALFSLKDGQVGPLIEMRTGFHVVKVIKRQHAGKKPFDDK